LKMNNKLLARVLVFTASCINLAEPSLSAATLGDSPRTSGVWCERRSAHAITKEHESRLALSLRRITGFGALQFASDGSLSLGDSSVAAGGSAEARRILMRAVCSGAIFVIEDYSGSGSVNFGQAAQEQVCEARDGRSSQIWRLRLDFDDFQQMQASSKVRASFDEGLTLFHELLHGLGYMDASRARELGPCEEIVNRVRSELGLPLRDEYFGEAWRIAERLTSVRLRFRSQARNGNSARWESHYLFFLLTEPAECCANIRAVTRVDRKPRQ
jgi:hypothetical protein